MIFFASVSNVNEWAMTEHGILSMKFEHTYRVLLRLKTFVPIITTHTAEIDDARLEEFA